MKILFLLIVLALAGVGVYQFYLKDHPPAWMNGLTGDSSSSKADGDAAPVDKKDFKDVSVLLQGDMDRIPKTLREAREMPTHAFQIKSRVAPYLQQHGEYMTLTQVCDSIIGADQDFEQRQGKCGLGPVSPGAGAPSAAAYPQQEAIWENRRRQADSDVRSRLASLENHRL